MADPIIVVDTNSANEPRQGAHLIHPERRTHTKTDSTRPIHWGIRWETHPELHDEAHAGLTPVFDVEDARNQKAGKSERSIFQPFQFWFQIATDVTKSD